MIDRKWDIQWASNWWLSVGFHLDHADPSLTLHLPGVILCVGRCKQPGFANSVRRKDHIKFAWFTVARLVYRCLPYLREEFKAYKMRGFQTGFNVFDFPAWLHRRWFPGKYAYEYQCPDCRGTITFNGLCMHCGERWDAPDILKPL